VIVTEETTCVYILATLIIDTGVGLHVSDVTRINYNNNAIRLTINYETTSVSMFTIINVKKLKSLKQCLTATRPT